MPQPETQGEGMKVYKIYDPQENEFLGSRTTKEEAITDADNIWALDQF